MTQQPETSESPIYRRSRSGPFVLHFQLQGFCNALRLALQCGHKPGATSFQVFAKLHTEWRNQATGRQIEDFPELDANASAADLLVVAETLLASSLAFLTPEQISEKRSAFGFAAQSAQ